MNSLIPISLAPTVEPGDWLAPSVTSVGNRSTLAAVPELAVVPTMLVAALLAGVTLALAAIVRVLTRRSGEATPTPSAEIDPSSASSAFDALDSDEQFVVDFLRENDGRVHQSAIVEASNWSKSKVSRLLSRMAREGYVEKVSVGRENVVVLGGANDDAESRQVSD